MKTQFHESADLLDMLLFTVKVIATSEPDDKQRIANAYQDARSLVATIGLDDEGSARPRIVGVVCGRGRNPTLRFRPSVFAGEIDVLPAERRDMGQEIGR